MSKKVQTKDIPSEDVSESSVSVRRSTRISSSQNAVGSPIVKAISTRRSSSSSAASKETNGDTDRNSPVVEKRKTRRTSTDSDINPTPIKTRRSSISKIVEEEKKLTSSPNTPTRKSTRSMSRSPSNISEVPARRTRRSSQDTEPVVEQQPARRSTRRRPSADTQEDATKEETVEQPKPVTRRRRSSSTDEPEPSKIDTKAKTKRLFSEDNQLEPIQEREIEPKDDVPKVSESASKTVHELSIIEEIEDADGDESEKIIKDIDDVLADKDSSQKPKSAVPENVSSKSIFSPLTPKVKEGKTAEMEKEAVEGIKKATHADSPRKKDAVKIAEKDNIESLDKDVASKEKRQSLKKKDEDFLDEKSVETTSEEATTIVSRQSTEAKKFISDGSDDSFTLKLSLDKSLLKEDQSHEDEVFSSPGSNKENSSINIPVPAKQRVSINKSKTTTTPSPNAKRSSFYEVMDVDDDDFSNTEANLKLVAPTSEESSSKSKQNVEDEKIDVVEIDSRSNSPEQTGNCVSESFANINSSQSDILDSSLNSVKTPEKSTLTDTNISRSEKTIDDKDDSSSDLSIKLVDSDEEDVVGKKIQSPPKVDCVKRSKRPRLSDGTSKTILQRLQQNVEDESNDPNQELVSREKPKLKSLIEENIGDKRKSSDKSINVDEESEEPESPEQTTEEKSLYVSSKTEKTLDKVEPKKKFDEENKVIDEVISNHERSQTEGVLEQNKDAIKSTTSEDSIENKSISEKMEPDQQTKSQMEAVSPLKSKMHKMKDCGVNFSNPSPAKPRVELDSKTNSKLDEFLTKKLNALADDDSSEEDRDAKKRPSKVATSDKSMSKDFETNEFVDDMAEEFEEDSPSDGSNDIIDEGESINTTDSEADSDESYDLDDSFIADDSEPELLEGDEYDLEINGDESNIEKQKRRRIIPKQDSTSEEEIEESTTKKNRKDLKVKKTETPKGKSPKATPIRNSPKLIEKTDFAKPIPEKSSTPVIKTAIPSIRIDETAESAKDKSLFEERIRSLVEPKLGTPNNSFSEAANTSKLNNSARSSSIIIQENISINDMQSDLIADKLQQVVKVFCAGIRSSDGNISMNVSLDFTENTPSAPVSQDNQVINVDDIENEDNPVDISQKFQESSSEMKNTSYRNKESPSFKKQRSPSKLDKSVNQSMEVKSSTSQVEDLEFSSKTNDLLVSKTKKNRRSSHKLDKSVDRPNLIESEDLELSVKTHDVSGEVQKSKKKRRSSIKMNKSVDQSEVIEPTISQDEGLQLSQIGIQIHDLSAEVPTSKKKRRSSHNFAKQSNESEVMETSNSDIKESGPSQIDYEIQDLGSNSRKKRRSNNLQPSGENQELNVKGSPKNNDLDDESMVSQKKRRASLSKSGHLTITSGGPSRSPSTTEKREQELNNSAVKQLEHNTSSKNIEFDYTNEEKDKTTTESEIEEKQPLKKKKRNRKKKNTKSVTNKEEPKQQITSKRLKLLEMACEELPPNDLRHKLPSNNEYSKTADAKTNKIRLKRLQSNLSMKYARLGELITNVKNRPKRSIKPSSSVDNSGWIVEVDNVRPSVSNEASAFNYKKINEKDFKNQMLYDPRIRREPTAKLLKSKGYYL